MVATFETVNSLETKDEVKVVNNYVSLVKGVDYLSGIIGSFIFFPIGGLLGYALLYKVKSQNKKLIKNIRIIVDSIPDLESSQLIDMHLEVERLNKHLSSINPDTEVYTGFYHKILTKVDSVINDINTNLKNLEVTLLKAAYPEIQRELSTEEFNSLKESFSNCDTSDWEDDSLDIYGSHYCLSK